MPAGAKQLKVQLQPMLQRQLTLDVTGGCLRGLAGGRGGKAEKHLHRTMPTPCAQQGVLSVQWVGVQLVGNREVIEGHPVYNPLH